VNDAFTDLTGLRKNALSLLEVPNKIQIVDATENAPMVKLDAEKMCRVFVNIIKNAIDAMPESGTLTVKSREVNGKLEISFKDTVEQACQKKP
jgi:signal transduction histidine kinase